MSKLDDLVEQLAFGTDPSKGGTCLGLYLGPDVVYLSETHMSGGKLVVDHMVRIPIPSDGKGAGATATMNTDFLADPAKIGSLIRQSMSQLRWNTKNVRVTLSHHLGLLRYFAMPAMERRFLRSAVPLEAKKYIPIPFDILAHDFSAAPLPPDAAGRARVGILIAVTQKKNIANVQGLLASIGLNLIGLEVAPCSVLRMRQIIDPQKDAPYAHVHIDGGNVRVMVVDRGVPVFFREVFLGQDAGLSDMRKIDLSGCLTFVQKQLGLASVPRMYLSGNLANLAGLADAFGSETGLTVSIQDTPKLLSVKSGDWGGYASLGASAQPLSSAAAPLDLAAAGRVTEEERKTARYIFMAGAVAGLFFGGAGIVKSLTYTYNAQELHKYQKMLDPDIALSLAGQTPATIEPMLKEMQLQLTQLQTVIAGSKRLKVSVILKEIIDAMPEHVWLERLAITNELQAKDSIFGMVLSGHVQDKSVADEQALAFNFKESLIKNPLLGKAFDISISVQKKGDDITPQASVDSKSLGDKLEKRTEFQMELKARK